MQKFWKTIITKLFFLTAFQIAVFIFFNNSLAEICVSLGAERRLRGGVGWGIKTTFSFWLFALICLTCGFFAGIVNKKRGILTQLIGFLIYAIFFAEDLLHLTIWTHPYRAALLVLCAFIALTLPFFLYVKVFEQNERFKSENKAVARN